MLRSCRRRLLQATLPQVTTKLGYKNYVMSDALAQMEMYCESLKCAAPIRKRKVTVYGAGSDVGRIVTLCLKMQSAVKQLSLYDDVAKHHVIGVANDIAHIDTNCAVDAYQGRTYLKKALTDADVVVICGGRYVMPPCCNILDRDLFFQNLQHVRTAVIGCAMFAPNALIAVQTPPVDCNFTLCKYILDQYHIYNPKKLLGVNAVNSMRAGQMLATKANIQAGDAHVPIVGGTGRVTRVPVYSGTTYFHCVSPEDYDCMIRLVREADDLICCVKCNNEQGHLSIGYATARFATNCLKGLYEKPTMAESALVEIEDPSSCYGLKYCSVPITIGDTGIVKYHIPKLNPPELELLKDSQHDLEDMLEMGRCNAVGDEYIENLPNPKQPCYIPMACPVGTPCKNKADAA
ncbi:malate dehydrogenase, mitochondrial-like [Hyposmocoma kahamanoa]|uniref:malate dehydrogenase, mitochondrial-like n=1 Tax=Hyposmocoma kahamanoa TaxID=1477025 RepID=UPI000E6D834E|nr:malate dehydrogenase, mitochondrial-like [Hyposmocoma kahamanoa]